MFDLFEPVKEFFGLPDLAKTLAGSQKQNKIRPYESLIRSEALIFSHWGRVRCSYAASSFGLEKL